MKHDKDFTGCKTDVISINESSIEIFRYNHTVCSYWYIKLKYKRKQPCWYSVSYKKTLCFFAFWYVSSVYETLYMENELFENV